MTTAAAPAPAAMAARLCRWTQKNADNTPTDPRRAAARRAWRQIMQASIRKDRAAVALRDAPDHEAMVAAATRVAAVDREILEAQRALDAEELR